MELQDSVLKAFADAVNSSGSASSDATTFYATVVREDEGIVYVRLYGADESIETPATTTVEVGTGDVVMVRMKDHKVTIVGNISYPALTRVGDIYITLTADGLVVGRLNEYNVPIGTHILITNSDFQLIGANGAVLAKFGSDVELGPTGSVRSTITSQGLKVFNASGTMIAQFGATAQLGPTNSAHVVINGSNMIFYNASGAEVLRAGTGTSDWNGFTGIETQGTIVANNGRIMSYMSGNSANGRVTAGNGALIADLSGGMPIPERDIELVASTNWVGLHSHNNPNGWIAWYNLNNQRTYLYSHMSGGTANVVAVSDLLRGGISSLWSGELDAVSGSTDWNQQAISSLANWNVVLVRVRCGNVYTGVVISRSNSGTTFTVRDYNYTHNGIKYDGLTTNVKVDFTANYAAVARGAGPDDTTLYRITSVTGIIRSTAN